MRSSMLVLALAFGCGGPHAAPPDAALDAASDASEDAAAIDAAIDATLLYTCGASTHEQAGTCIADSRFELRAPPAIRADGYSPVDMRAFGFDAAGLPASDRVIVTVDRVTAGQIASPVFALGDLGGATTFIPCNAADASNTTCAGPAQLELALASAPQLPLATADVELVAPTPVGDVTPCLAGGNILHYDTVDYGTPPTLTISSNGVFDVFGSLARGVVHVFADDVGWSLTFDVSKLGIPMLPSIYEDAKQVGYADAGEPVYQLTGIGNCTPISRFQIHTFTYDADTQDVIAITATFEEHCDTDPTRTRTGCVHYTQ